MTDKYSDIELIKIIQENRRETETAFRELFRRYSKTIYLFCRKFLGTNSLAEDATQETFLKFLKYVQQGNNIDHVKSFLFMIAKNLCINLKKTESRYDDIAEYSELQYEDKSQDNREIAKLIDSALELLPENQREAFCLQMYSGFTYKEIAELNDVPVSTVRNWIVRAKLRLRKILSPYFDEMS